MNDIDTHRKDLHNTSSEDKKKNIKNRTESSITESLSETPLTQEQKMDNLSNQMNDVLCGVQNMTNGVTQVIELFKEMIKVQIDTSAMTNKVVTEQTNTIKQLIEGQENTIKQSIAGVSEIIK